MSENFQLSIFKCKWCGALLSSKRPGRALRSDKVFCSGSHRAAYSNWVKRSDKMAKQVVREVHELGKYLDYPEQQERALELMTLVFKALRKEAAERGILIKAVDRA